MKNVTKSTLGWGFAATLAIGAGVWGCGGGQAGLEPRFVAVHNAMTAMGLAQTGPISEGSLPQGAEARVDITLDGGECYTFVALGTTQVRDLDLRILSADDEDVGRDTTHDRQAAAQVCPDRSGDYVVVVGMAAGQGGYTMSSWSGAPRRASGAGPQRGASGGGGSVGTCGSPLELEAGTPVHGSTQQGESVTQGSCASGTAREQVYRLELSGRAQVRAVIESSFDGALYMLRSCGQPQTEIACNDDAPSTTRSEISTTLDPGIYFLVVDGYGDESGEYDLIVEVSDLQSLASICGDAPPLPVGRPVSGSTQGLPNYFHASCAGGARSADRVYVLDVAARSRLRVSQQSDHDGSLYVRTSCEDPTSEIACNDDYVDNRHALVTAVVDPGRYYVYSDGFSSDQAGNFTLNAELTPAQGGGATADACGATGSLALGQQIEVDTFVALDDYAGSCGGQGAPDVVYELNVRNRSRLRAAITESQFEGAVYIQRTCGDASTEVACEAVPMGGEATLDTVLAPGRYFLVMDGQRPETFGAVKIQVALDDLAALQRTCRRAPILRPGRILNGDTSGESDDFRASCAGGAMSNDTVYRLRLRRRQIVRINLSSDYDGAVHLRRDCADVSTELACNDDQPDNRHSFIETTLDAGTYYVIVDGFRTGNAGPYTLDVQTSDP